MALAKVLGAKGRQDGYVEGAGFLVSWCVGHLVEMAPADAYDPRYSKWNYDDLPIVPNKWLYQVLPSTRKQFNILAALMEDTRVDTVVCATDAGREGELIFRLTYETCGCTKPVKRLWISSMEESAIRRGFENLSDGASYDNLYAAALCRAKADWLIGINGTRLFTTLYYNRFTVQGTAASRVFFRIVAKAVRMGRYWPGVHLQGLTRPKESPSASLSFAAFDLCR